MKVEGEFLDMLREDGEIRKGDKWNEVGLSTPCLVLGVGVLTFFRLGQIETCFRS